MVEQKGKREFQEQASHKVAAMAAVQTIAAMGMTTVLIPSIIGRYAGLDQEEIHWVLFATLVSSAVMAFMQPLRLGRFGSGLVMLGGASPAFVGVAGFALASGGLPLLSMLTLCSLPAVLAFARYAHWLRRVLRPAVMGTIIMLVASSLAQVVWHVARQPMPRDAPDWSSPAIFALTFLSMLCLAVFSGERLRFWAPLLGLGIGLLGAGALGGFPAVQVDGTAWFGVPESRVPVPSPTPWPTFLALLPSFTILQVVVSMESYSCSRLAKSVYFRNPDPLDQRSSQGSVLVNGLGTLVAGVLGALPTTTYSSSVSILGLTGITSNRVGFWAAGILVLLAISPLLILFIVSIPAPVAAGYLLFVVVLMFSNGMRMATENGLDLSEGVLVLSGFWIGLSLQAGIFSDHFGEIGSMVQSAGTSVGGLLTLLFVGLLNARVRGQVRRSIVPSDDGYQDMQDAVARYSVSVGADRESSDRLLLACEEATNIVISLRRNLHPRRPPEQIAINLREAGEFCAVELVTLPTTSGLDALRDRAFALQSEETPEDRLELAGFRILQAIAPMVSHSKYQDVDILNFYVKIRRL